MTHPILGVDPSYTGTAIAGDGGFLSKIATGPGDGHDVTRARAIAGEIAGLLAEPHLVVLEAPAHAATYGGARLGILAGVIRSTVLDTGSAFLDVAPGSLKKFATGRGNANKTDMVIAARERLAYPGTDDDMADALWLHQLGHHYIGNGTVTLPATHLTALVKVREAGVVHP